ncbi:nuclear transport factor 2 family protein [uncultured Paraglaciecola sp.]|uniref:YybH family protein n=1 Tax=uncultured Paraglaciecola sp. TaxID=1765024 RepID=UPI00262A7F19|nr:nuclear transport factor 2 family protein [uncultured Paraglaciecola sp.]
MRYVQIVAALLFLCSVATAQPGSEEDRIMELETKWSTLYGDRDLEGIMALMTKNSVLIMPSAAPIVGIEDIRNATKKMLESQDKVSWRSDSAHISASGDMAYDYGTAKTTLADGSIIQGYYLVVWSKENGQWKVAADMFN